MSDFFEELALAKENIAGIKISVEEIRAVHDRTLNNVISEQQNAGWTRSNNRNGEGIRCSNGQGKSTGRLS